MNRTADLPRRGDEDLREATEAPVFLVQRRRLSVTDPSGVDYDSDVESMVDDDSREPISDERVVERGNGRWEWDTDHVAFTRAEGDEYASARSHDGPWRIYSVPTRGAMREVLRALTEREGEPGLLPDPGRLRPGRYRAAVRHVCHVVGQLGTEGVDARDLQEVLTEVHLSCMIVDPTLDDCSPRYAPDLDPPLLHRAADLLREHLAGPASEDLRERTRLLLERADPVVNPGDADDDDDEEYIDDLGEEEGRP